MKKILLAVTLSLTLFLTAAGSSYGSEPRTIRTNKTQQHKHIFEIPLLVALPQKNSLINTPTGAADTQLGYTLDASVIYAPLELLMREFTETKLDNRGIELKSHTRFLWNGSQAVLMKIFHPLDDGKVKGQWILAIDRYDHTWLASGAYDAKNQQSSAEILEILKTAWWDEAECQPIRRDAADAVIDISGTPFRLAKTSSGALIYTKDGKLPTQSADGAIFIASRTNNAHIGADKQTDFAKEKCVKAALENELEIISEKVSEIDGRNLMEIVARADSEEEDTIIYMVMAFGVTGGYNTMVGIAHAADQENLQYFRRLTENCIDKFIRQ